MPDTGEEQATPTMTEMSVKQTGQVVLLGAVAGLIAAGATLLFSAFVFKTLPCVAETCGTGGQYAAVLASIVSGATALFWLMRVQVFRPLLVVLAVTIGLWGISLYVLAMPWYAVLAISAGLHAVAYTLFAWISRLRQFWLVIFFTVLIVVGLRFILAS